MKLFRYNIYLIFIILTFAGELQSKILMRPYLQAVSSSGITIMVETDSKNPPEAVYFSNENNRLTQKSEYFLKTDSSSKRYVHRIQLKNLEAFTKYNYFVKDGSSSSIEANFVTAPLANESFTFAVMGDCRSGIDKHRDISKMIKSFNPAFSLYNGDLCINSSYKAFKKEFFIKEELELTSCVPFFNAVGNHEGWSDNYRAFTQAPASASGKQEWYSFDYGDIHVLVLSTEHSCKPGSEQYQFVEKDLSESKKKIKIVSFHESAYCAGGHGNNEAMVRVSENLFEKYKVDLVLTGHSHFYQNNFVNGIHHITDAGAGAPLYNPGKAEFTVKSAKEYHFGIAEYKDDFLKLTIYGLNGQTIDTIIIDKRK